MSSSDDLLSKAGGMSSEQIRDRLDELFREKASVEGAIVVLLGEVDRRQAYRDEGATSAETWAVERFGVSTPTARALVRLSEKAWDLPHLVGGLCAGEVSLDKVRTVAGAATPENDGFLRARAGQCSVRQLADVARSTGAAPGDAPDRGGVHDHDRRFLRFNDRFRTLSVQLPGESYAEARACLEARARQVPSDGETPWDQRCCDAFMELVRSSGRATASTSPYVVVVHVPLAALVDDAGDTSALAGELEGHGFVSGETVLRLACDATIVLAVDDDVGHTMYEGRARREPNDAQRREIMRRDRHCRFPGCTNVTFSHVHHVQHWKAGGRTDLGNLALLCVHHHHLVHSAGWTMTGDANTELTFVGPSRRIMTSRPSPLWTAVSAARA